MDLPWSMCAMMQKLRMRSRSRERTGRHPNGAPLPLILTLLLSACGSGNAPIVTASPTGQATAAATPTLPLTLAVGQVLAASFSGAVITPAVRHLIVDDKVGTILLFRANFGNAAGLQRMTAALEALGREAGLPAPLMVTIDEEGGTVDQLGDGISLLPSEQSLGSTPPVSIRTRVAVMARGLRAEGVGLDLAPVADLRTNPADAVIGSRSFGPDVVAAGPRVAAWVEGLHDGGVAATLKHFPGLGGAAGDPHSEVVSDPVTPAHWLATSAASFSAGIGAGADAVMTTSLRVPNLDPTDRPALLLPVIVRLLRDTLHFRGVIVTDSLSMAAVGESMPRATVDAAAAGNDLMLMSSGSAVLEDQADALLLDAVRTGRVAQSQIEASAQRVIALRTRYGGSVAPVSASRPTARDTGQMTVLTPMIRSCQAPAAGRRRVHRFPPTPPAASGRWCSAAVASPG